MPRFRLIPHTSDIGLYSYGDTLEEEFSNAAYGIFSVMTDLRKVREIELRRFSVESMDNEALLFDWLNQLLYLLDVEHLLFKRFEVMIDKFFLFATCYGEYFNPERHKIIIGVNQSHIIFLKLNKRYSGHSRQHDGSGRRGFRSL